MDGAEFFFEGVRRLDWGLGNPNKTAALIAEAMVAVWVLAYVRQRLFWLSLLLFTVLGCCLVLTFSRGGMVACCAGLAVLAASAPRPWPWQKVLAVLIAVTVVVCCAARADAHRRYFQGVLQEDRSITNRIELWKAVPAMMSDSPGGWGLGNAGKAYMQWYQPVVRDERYRTMVNSHLTWLVEFGWPLRFLYVFGWLASLNLCGAGERRSKWAVALGVWTAFGVAAFFSSVAESPWLWVVPLTSLIATLAIRMRMRTWPSVRNWTCLAGLSLMICACLWGAGSQSGSLIKGDSHSVRVGAGAPSVWMAVDENGLGGEEFAKVLRGRLSCTQAHLCIGVVRSLDCLPRNISGARVVVAGAPDGVKPEKMQEVSASASRVILLAPGFHPQEAGFEASMRGKTDIIFGEFSQSPFLMSWEKEGSVRRVAGSGDYFPDWPDIICGTSIKD